MSRKLFLRAVFALLLPALIGGCVAVGPEAPPSAKPDPHQAAVLNTQLGIAYMGEGKMAVAQDRLNRAISEDPDYADAHAAMGMFYTRRGNLDEAEKSYRRALAIDPSRAEILNAVGSFLCDRGQKDEGLKDLLAAANTLTYTTPEISWTNAGICALSAQRQADAEQYLRNALKINPNYPDALLRMADLSYFKRDYAGTLSLLQRFERVAAPTPVALLLGAKTARQLGDNQDAQDYEIKLIQKFPNSDQARELQQKRAAP